MVHCCHQYKSVINTFGEEEELPYTVASTFLDADADLRRMGSNKPLSQRGLCGAGQTGVPRPSCTSMTAFVTASRWTREPGRNKAKEMVLLPWIFPMRWPTKGKPEFLSWMGTDLLHALRTAALHLHAYETASSGSFVPPWDVSGTHMRPRAKGPPSMRKGGRTRPTKPSQFQYNFVHLSSNLPAPD